VSATPPAEPRARALAGRVEPLPERLRPDAVALWHAVGLTRPWNDPEADLLRALRGPDSTVLAALDGDRLVGTAMVGSDGHRGWVYYLAVAPGEQRHGWGRRLVQECERWVLDRGIPKLQLMVREDNDRALDFYAALGYETVQVHVLGRRLDG